MFFRIISLIFIALAVGNSLAADLETFLEQEQPSIREGVSNVKPESKNGMAWRWKVSDGRRDYGEFFKASRNFSAEDLAIQALISDPFRAGKRAAFELVFLRFLKGSLSGETETMAIIPGFLPRNVGIPHDQPAWLRLKFPPVEFKKDESYGFLLRFKEEGGNEQGIVFSVTNATTADGGHGIKSSDGQVFEKAPSLNFLLGRLATDGKAAISSRTPRILVVDRRGSTGFRTIAAAVAEAKPGDTIQLAPGSGPYREAVFIAQSGEPGNPITLDGSGETVTGFEPLVFQRQGSDWVCDLRTFFAGQKNIQGFQKKDGRWVNPSLNAFPAVITYKGKRLFQDATTGQFPEFVRLSEDRLSITLLPGVEPEGWEISSRDAVVRILNASYHIYKNIKATGSLNDGFNLHGKGDHLVFENIEAFHNIDEGFSAHDQIECTIEKGSFWGNDNGIGNIANSVMTVRHIQIYSNSGYGLWLFNCKADLQEMKVWGNGVAQIALHGSTTVSMKEVSAVKPSWTTKPWLTYEESAGRKESLFTEVAPTVRAEGTISELTEIAAH